MKKERNIVVKFVKNNKMHDHRLIELFVKKYIEKDIKRKS